MMIKTILVDDEQDALDILERDLANYCPDVVVIKQFRSAIEAKAAILELRPDLVFLDIEMPEIKGIDLAKSLKDEGFSPAIIFVTAYPQFGAQAFEVDAVDFLLKPVESDRLKQAVEKYMAHNLESQIAELNKKAPTYIRISSQSGFDLLQIEDICYLKADGPITRFYLVDKHTVAAGRNLGIFEKALAGQGFFRVHNGYLVNYKFIRQYDNKESCIVLSTGVKVPVAQQRLRDFLIWIDAFTA
ncbi:LytTR family DNA-binding domain-containing protein [Haliscomenobacter sp.]|uniref:LytR/AlgR family response regulator transcription factor n=1 Tax=Haliscomenobacter sp. TaxID=2717303 RepID=UPI002D1FB77B|nr:LytTR family DNA-binding domain-containing protein [Haliscomenobacter sp.]